MMQPIQTVMMRREHDQIGAVPLDKAEDAFGRIRRSADNFGDVDPEFSHC